ncbi:MAG: glycosyltransferase family 4 protein [Leptolyngbyaceae cyanobacterium]
MRNPVLTIFYQFNPWKCSIGGIQTLIKSFIKYAPDRFEVRLVGTGEPGQVSGRWHEAEFSGKALQFFPLIEVGDDNRRKLVPTTLKYTASLFGKSLNSDFMHFHRLEPTAAAWRWAGDKTLFVHNDIHQQINAGGKDGAILWQRFSKLYFLMERSLLGQFSQVLSCNTQSVKLYQDCYPAIADRVTYYKNAFDTDIFYPLEEAERQHKRQQLAHRLKLSPDTRFLLFAGRLHPQKDPLLLARSLAAVSDPSVHLLVAGDGELKEALQDEVQQLGVTQQVTLLGPLPQEELVELHQVASACVLTSAYEGLPIVVLEALACGTPVVTTDCGETPHLLSEGSGIVCSSRQPEAIASSWQRVLNNPLQFTTSACVQVAQPYSARIVVEQIYQDMLQRWHKQMETNGTTITYVT